MKTYEGGSAIMLALPELPELRRLASAWIFGQPGWETNEDLHLTLQFVGRDLPSLKIAAMISGVFFFAEHAKALSCEFTGAFEILSTKKGRYLVALVNPAPLLKERERLQAELKELGVVSKDTFAFRPHVTLAEAPSNAEKRAAPGAISEFKTVCTELTVKYGRHEMEIEFGGETNA